MTTIPIQTMRRATVPRKAHVRARIVFSARARLWMVMTQIAARGITNKSVLDALATVPRHSFVPSAQRFLAYEDCPLPIGFGQTISQPYIVGVMTQAMMLTGRERVLEIGAGSGYQAAVLSRLASEVITMERIPSLARRAERTLNKLKYDNVAVREGDGSRGWAEGAPYDRIIVTAGAPALPEPLKEQLKPDGFIVIPVGDEHSQVIQRWWTRHGDWMTSNVLTEVRFVPLGGQHGWPG